MKILFTSSEVLPLVKTGGLADVSASLPKALKSLGHDVRILLPAYPQAVAKCTILKRHEFDGPSGAGSLFEATLPGTNICVWLLDSVWAFSRTGNPYLDGSGVPWEDNPYRFAFLSRIAVEIAQDRMGLSWQPDIVHCNDWQTALVPALLSLETRRPATLFTIHNLAYQGVFPEEVFHHLGLPVAFWDHDGLEFYGQVSFMKGGLVYADRITTVSPNYAREITTSEFGCGLEGLLRYRKDVLAGIINGVDADDWNPAHDPYLHKAYSAQSFENKAMNSRALRMELDLPDRPDLPLVALIGRLVEQKGIDLILDVLERLLALPLQLVILGSGQPEFEDALQSAAMRYPEIMVLRIAYDEGLAHRIEAGANLFLMPSRFEPCGLNQMYSQKYGTLPLVHAVGGLEDTVVDADDRALLAGEATGFKFYEPTAMAFMDALQRALFVWQRPDMWARMALKGMLKDFSWEASARLYEAQYAMALASRKTF